MPVFLRLIMSDFRNSQSCCEDCKSEKDFYAYEFHAQ